MSDLEPKLPRQVVERADKADKLMKEKEEEQKKAQEGKTELDEDGKPLVQAPENKQAGDDDPIPVKKDPVEEGNYEQKYKVLKGKYDKEVKLDDQGRSAVDVLTEKVRFLENQGLDLVKRNNELVDLLGAIPDTPADPADPAAPNKDAKTDGPIDYKKYLTEEELAQFKDGGYDEEDLKVMALFASRIADQQVKPLAANMQNITKNAAVNKVNSFWDAMKDAIPDRLKLEEDPDFEPFMLERAPYQQVTRQKVLMSAVKRLDLQIVSEIYKSFRVSKGIKKAPEVPKTPGAKPNLKGQIEPGSGQGSENLIPKEGKIWTPEEASKFYTDWSLGRIPEEEGAKIAKDIDAAKDEGRYLQQ